MTKPTAKKHEGGERIEALRKKLRDDPRSLAFIELAEELNRTGAYAEAAEVAQRGLLSHPDSVAGRLALAVAEAEQNHIREALEEIKRALLIDQENPKALALMGRILLKKGLAKRAVQFLSHAVRFDPRDKEYGELLRDARAQSKTSSEEAPLPVFDGDQVSDSGSPWNDEDSSGALAAEEHTVFDPDAAKLMKKKTPSKSQKLDEALSNLPGVGDDEDAEEEPTKFHHRKGDSQPKRPADEPPHREEPTKLATEELIARNKKAKMGGSAAEYSQMMSKATAQAATDEAERRVHAEAAKHPPPPPPPEDNDSPPTDPPRPNAEVRPPPKAPSVERAVKEEPAKAEKKEPSKSEKPEKVEKKEPSKSEKAKSEKPERSEKPEKAEKPEKVDKPEKADKPEETEQPAKAEKPEKPKVEKPEKPAKIEKPEKKDPAPVAAAPAAEPNKQVGHMATRMVDEALWALLGKMPEQEAKRPEPEAKPEKAKPEAKADKKDKAKEEAAPEPRPGAPMVVRTSERYGTWTAAAVLFILCVAALWAGYAIVLAARGPGPETATEELKGIASDLERGGLAALIGAEEKIVELERTNPDLRALMSAALAEVYARRWHYFGRDPKVLAKSREQIKIASAERPTVELLAAMTLVSTSAATLGTIDAELERALEEYKESPKIWVVRANVAELAGRPNDVPAHLYRAFAINPQHRLTLLELTRWHASQGAYGTAFSVFDQLQDKYPLDVEAAIDRYVLGQITGKDPAEAQAVTTLAGLVRDEIPEVAKDEAGRAAIAFALPKFAKGDLVEGLEELSKADRAFDDSPRFKEAIAGLYLSVGEWERAREQYQKAVELEPDVVQHQIGLARATLGERSGRKPDADEEKKRAAKDKMKGGVAELPFATVRFVPREFELVKVEPDASFFPEGEYRALVKRYSGEERAKALDAASLRAVARLRSREEKHDEAIELLREAAKLADDPKSEYELGMAYLAKEDWNEAIRVLKNALDKNNDNVAARLALAHAYLGKGNEAKALAALADIGGDVQVPNAQLMVARLKMRKGDYEDALASLTAVAETLPRSQVAHVLMGEALVRLKRDQDADASFAKALSLGGKLSMGEPPPGMRKLSPVALLGLGRVEVKTTPKRGIALLKLAAKEDDVPDSVHFYLGEAYLASKKKKEGKKELEKYMKLVNGGELKERAERLLKGR